jgi:GntR family transcriptional repressor for pyruvate dehydrogenase complex
VTASPSLHSSAPAGTIRIMQSISRSAAIAAELRDEILRGQYRRGERLPSERDLAERFGVHRGAVREALKQLESLGLADIQPGGTRVAPIEEASVDVVQHLLDLEDPPNPRTVEEVLEVMSGLFTMSARLAAERADDEQRRKIGELIKQLEDTEPADEQVKLIHELGDHMVEAAGNLVLTLVRRGVKTHFLERLEPLGLPAPPPDWPGSANFRELAKAIEERDGPAASEAVYRLSLAIRRHALELIESERSRRNTRSTAV